MSDKLGMSLEDLIPKKGAGKGGKGGKGGAMKKMGAGRGARAAAAPYQKPMKPGKGKGAAGLSLSEITQAKQPVQVAAAAPAAPAFVLTTGTTLRVGNLERNVSRCVQPAAQGGWHSASVTAAQLAEDAYTAVRCCRTRVCRCYGKGVGASLLRPMATLGCSADATPTPLHK